MGFHHLQMIIRHSMIVGLDTVPVRQQLQHQHQQLQQQC
jgi:hypothetical protein